ncbi:hypothetical protein QV09_07455 [Gallibacterium salpingitidis]|uniref:Autotransporter domain-containing protein n=2 Tax=Gallibacterium salpingitidis TaxID=505341 RepID=A0AB36E1S1_9PAST|nr:hypothetical protein QV09_07455 [Gallibacterium salpingitidis]
MAANAGTVTITDNAFYASGGTIRDTNTGTITIDNATKSDFDTAVGSKINQRTIGTNGYDGLLTFGLTKSSTLKLTNGSNLVVPHRGSAFAGYQGSNSSHLIIEEGSAYTTEYMILRSGAVVDIKNNSNFTATHSNDFVDIGSGTTVNIDNNSNLNAQGHLTLAGTVNVTNGSAVTTARKLDLSGTLNAHSNSTVTTNTLELKGTLLADSGATIHVTSNNNMNGGTLKIHNGSTYQADNGLWFDSGTNTIDLDNSTFKLNAANMDKAGGAVINFHFKNNSKIIAGGTGAQNLFGNFTSSDTITVTGANTIEVTNAGATTTQFGNMSGMGSIEKTGAGTLVYAGDNTYEGGTTVTAGTLQLGNGGATGKAGTGGIYLASDTTLALNHGAKDFTLDNAISGSGKISQLAANTGTTTVTNDNTGFTGNVEVHSGTLQVGNGDTTGDIGSGTVTLDANTNLKINHNNAYTLDNTVTGEGNLIQAGRDKTSLKAGKTYDYTGKTTVSGSELDIVAGTHISNTSDVLIDSGSDYITEQPNQTKLTVNGQLTTAGHGDVEINNGVFTVNGTATVGNIKSTDNSGNQLATVTVNNGGTLTTKLVDGDTLFAGFKTSPQQDTVTINGTWNASVGKDVTVKQDSNAKITGDNTGKMNKGGAGTLVLTADNSGFAGKTAINAGTLQAGDGGETGTFGAGNITIANGATAAVNRSNDYTLTQQITGTGTLKQDGAGKLILNNAANNVGDTVVNNGTLEVAANLTSTNVHINNGKLAVNDGVTLNSTTVDVGDDNGNADTAVLDNKGTVTATDVNVKKDGKLDSTGTLNASNKLTVDGGTVNSSGTTTAKDIVVDNAGNLNVKGGKTTATGTTKVNNGTVTVDNAAELAGGAVTVGDKDGAAGSAKIDNKGTMEATSVTVNGPDGQVDTTGNLTVDNTLTVDGGKVNVNGGTTTAAITDIKDGAVAVENGAKLDSDTIKVGDGTGNAESASLTNKGTVDSNNITVSKDGKLDNQGTLGDAKKPAITVDGGTLASSGTTNATSLTVNSGAVNVTDGKTSANTTTINDGTVTLTGGELAGGDITIGDKNGAAGSAKLDNQNGKVTAGNITVNGPDGQLDNAKELKATGELKADGGTINSSGTTTAKDIVVDNAGNLNVKGGTTTADTTNIKEGTVTVDNGAKLDGGDITVGDGKDSTAALNANGEVEAKNLTVNGPDGKVAVGDDENKGSLKATESLTVNGGAVAIDNGQVETPKADINDGVVAVAKAAILAAYALNVGDGSGAENTASLTSEGTVTAKDLNVKKDGNLAVNAGEVTAVESAKVDGGTVAIAKDGTLNAGENGDKDFAVNAGNVTVDGTLNARNITSNTAEDGSTDDAKINVGKGANLNLNPQAGDLFAGLNTSKVMQLTLMVH